jgi:hypothetical protein
MAKRKADSISVTDLQAAVAKAVKLVNKKGISFEAPLAMHPGIIYGRVLRGAVTLENAQAAAEEITSNISAAAKGIGLPKLVPAVLTVERRIICGFVDPTRVPVMVK